MYIREATGKDVDRCLELSSQEDEEYWSQTDFIRSIQNNDALFLVSETEEKVIEGYILGFIVPTKPDEALIHECRTAKEFRGRKVGTSLVDAFCAAMFSKGVQIVYAMIDPDLEPFYIDSCGFGRTGQWIEVSRNIST